MLLKIIVACIAAIIMGIFMKWMRRKYMAPLNYPNKQLADQVEQTRVINIDCNPDKALLIARDALLSIPKCRITDTTGRKVKAKTGVTFRTFGESITIATTSGDPLGAHLTIESRPRFPGTTADYGKNYEIVEQIVEYLSKRHQIQLLSAN